VAFGLLVLALVAIYEREAQRAGGLGIAIGWLGVWLMQGPSASAESLTPRP
jgi:hypothetical protein